MNNDELMNLQNIIDRMKMKFERKHRRVPSFPLPLASWVFRNQIHYYDIWRTICVHYKKMLNLQFWITNAYHSITVKKMYSNYSILNFHNFMKRASFIYTNIKNHLIRPKLGLDASCRNMVLAIQNIIVEAKAVSVV